MTPAHRAFLKHWGAPNCRWCGELCDAEFVDVGVGQVQVTAGICEACCAVEMSPYFLPDGKITEVEMVTGWHGPFEDDPDYSSFNPRSEILL